MHQVSEPFHQSMTQLGMPVTGGSSNLVLVSELFEEDSTVSFQRRIALERAYKVGATAVYFKRLQDTGKSDIAQVYIYDFTHGDRYDIVELHRNIWSSTDVRIYFVITKTEILVFNASKPLLQHEGNASPLGVKPFDVLAIVGEAKDKYDTYSSKSFDTGLFWERNKRDFGYKDTAYDKLITQLRAARKEFQESIKLDKKVANKLLVISILVKYLEERIDKDAQGNETRVFSRNLFYKKEYGLSTNFLEVIKKGRNTNNIYLLNLLHFLSEHFNGTIFNIEADARNKLLNCDLTPLVNFLSGEVDNKQYVFWRLYSFNYLPIELISSIYEEILESDKSSGVAYTPAYLVNFLIDECMPVDEPKSSFKVFDPACGSGIFLVSAFKRLVDWWRINHYTKTGEWIRPSKRELPEIKKLLVKNIHGVDIASEAVDLTIFSLSLTLCDMLSPKVIWEDLKFDNLSNSVTCSDFFVWAGNKSSVNYDLIIGNPPFIEYSKEQISRSITVSGTSERLEIPNNQVSLLFAVVAARMLNKQTGLLCLILPSGPLLYNNSSEVSVNFRNDLFSKYNIPQVIDFTFLSQYLFKNKGNEKNVAVAAFFIQNTSSRSDFIAHIIAKKLQVMSQRHYFEFDHYDFHYIQQKEIHSNKYIWKANLLGGGRLKHLIMRLSSLPKLESFLIDKKKKENWDYGTGFIKGKADSLVTAHDLATNKFVLAPYLTGKRAFDTKDFTEKGIARTYIINDIYFHRPRSRNKAIYDGPVLLIKKSIGHDSIPIYFSEDSIAFRFDIIGIHAPADKIDELKSIYDALNNNQLYRFFMLATSARSGVNRSTHTSNQDDVLKLPYSPNSEDLGLSYAESIVMSDTMHYWLDFLSKSANIRMLASVKRQHIQHFGSVFCTTLNTVFGTQEKGQHVLTSFYIGNLFTCVVFAFQQAQQLEVEEIENLHIAQSILKKDIYGSHSMQKITRYYDGDTIIMVKPVELRFWLGSIALRDADEVIQDLFNAGY
ncbi:MAG: Eco57I restriction-modification methylase domain-containing protein [Janthinobacterium lividum]